MHVIVSRDEVLDKGRAGLVVQEVSSAAADQAVFARAGFHEG
jgi:hypothetical protein